MRVKYKKAVALLLALAIALCEFSMFGVASFAVNYIAIDKTAYGLSEEIKVNVGGLTKEQADAGAFVGIYEAGAMPEQYIKLKWEYIKLFVAGEWKVKAPNEPGSYEMRLYGAKVPDDGNLIDMTPFIVAYFSERNVKVSLNKEIYDLKEEMIVNMSGVKAEQIETKIWAGIYKNGAKADQYGKWEYYSYMAAGEWKVNVPSEAGNYELRVYTIRIPVDEALIATVPFSVGTGAAPPPASPPADPPAGPPPRSGPLATTPETPSRISPPATTLETPPRSGAAALSQGISIDFEAIPVETGVLLSWQTVDGASGYLVYRSTEKGIEGVSITDYAITANSFVDVNVDAGTTYFYCVKALFAETGADENPDRPDLPPIEKAITPLPAILGGNTSELGERKKNFILMKLNDPIMSINGIEQYVDGANPETTPVERNGRTLMPIRSVIEGMGGTVGWNGESKRITLEAGGHVVVMTLDQKSYTADGEAKEMDIAPGTINDRTMVPVRFVAENVGCVVDWINSTLQIVIVFYT